MPEQQNRPVGDFFAPYFSIRLFNLKTEPTATGLSEEAIQAGAAGGLTQAGSRFDRFNAAYNLLGVVASAGGSITSASGITFSEAAQDVANIGRDMLIDRHLPQVAASLTAESKSGSPFRVQLTLTPEYEDALIIMNSRLITFATIAEVEWGYSTPGPDGQRLGTRKHYVRNVYPKVTFGENISIVIEGHDFGYEFARRNISRKCWTLSDVNNYYDIIKTIIERNKPYVLEPADGFEAAAYEPAVAESGIFDTIDEGGVMQVGNDWQFVNMLLRRFNLTFYIEGNTFYVYSLVDPGPNRQNLAYTFRWRQQLTGAKDIPVYNATCNILNSFFNPPAARGLVNVTQDPETGEFKAELATPRDASHSAPDEKATTGGDASSPIGSIISGSSAATFNFNPEYQAVTITAEAAAEKTDAGDVVTTPPRRSSDTSTIDSRALTLVKEAGVFSAPRIKLKCPGVPDMFPNKIVKLVGFTDIFDGLYMVLNVKHMVTSGGYDMDVEVIRYSAVAATRPDAPPNTHRPTTDGSDTTPVGPDGVTAALLGGG